MPALALVDTALLLVLVVAAAFVLVPLEFPWPAPCDVLALVLPLFVLLLQREVKRAMRRTAGVSALTAGEECDD